VGLVGLAASAGEGYLNEDRIRLARTRYSLEAFGHARMAVI
jgi:hypothetical protein